MNDKLDQLLQNLHELEKRIEEEIHQRRSELQYNIHNGKVRFDEELRLKNSALKKSFIAYIKDAKWLVVLTAPFIYAVIIPFVLLDLFVSIYQRICFPVYGIPIVRRSEYLSFDRLKLDYLNGIQKINCAYCSYGNGILAFSSEVAARTEQYWCPIKHARRLQGAHKRYPLFTDFGDGEQFHQQIIEIRQQFDVDQ